MQDVHMFYIYARCTNVLYIHISYIYIYISPRIGTCLSDSSNSSRSRPSRFNFHCFDFSLREIAASCWCVGGVLQTHVVTFESKRRGVEFVYGFESG